MMYSMREQVEIVGQLTQWVTKSLFDVGCDDVDHCYTVVDPTVED
jgi:hypothetical protein